MKVIHKIIPIILSDLLQLFIEFLEQTLEVLIFKKLQIFADFFLILISKPMIDPNFYVVLCIFYIFHKFFEIDDCPINTFLFYIFIFAQSLSHKKIEENMQIVDTSFEFFIFWVFLKLSYILLVQHLLQFVEILFSKVIDVF